MTENIILCMKWGDKYDRTYVEKLRQQVKDNCSVPYEFYCITDNPTESYDIQLPPTEWDLYYEKSTNFFWAYRKLYMFQEWKTIKKSSWPKTIKPRAHEIGSEEIPKKISLGKFRWTSGPAPVPDQGTGKFLYLDLDVIINQDLKYFFELNMENPYITYGWWNDPNECHKNYSKFQSTPINSSIIRWDGTQLLEIYKHVEKHLDVIFFTYPTIDNYLNHFWYDMHNNEESTFNVFPQGDIYSWYKGNIFPNDTTEKKMRHDCKICLFNNSGENNDVEELKSLW